ncbi:IclR family transcriptional regulator [Brevibacterium samyangense]|uniref:IclR family transcriptional regulator n=1 Tax=Brevibacterium samyangense TaxID=366888 RepID=A0ABP5EVA0_9MICO
MARNDAVAGLASVQKAFALLDVVASHHRGMTAKEIASALDTPLPSVYRMLKTLVASEHLVHLKEESRYGLGYRLHALDASLRRQVGTPPAVAALVRDLHACADAAAYYAVHRGDDIVVAHVVDSPARPRITPMDFGFNDAAHATAFGKVLLAAMTPEQRDTYLAAHGLPAMTEATVTDRATLEAILADVTRSGIAVEQEEIIRGASCMAAPVRDLAGRTLGSVAVSLRPDRFAAHVPRLTSVLRETAHHVSCALRGTRLVPRRAQP